MNIFSALFGKRAQTFPSKEMRQIQTSTSVAFLVDSMRCYDGYYREAAIARSVALKDPRLLPTITERLNDWVPHVRDAARVAVMTLLPLMPASAVIAALPEILKLRTASRSDHSQWLADFTRAVHDWLPLQAFMAGLIDDNIHVARASFEFIQHSSLVDKSGLIRLTLTQRRDIVVALWAARMINALPPQEQHVQYTAAMQSHFGAVRTFAIRALLSQPFSTSTRQLATGVLLDPQLSVRETAIGHLIRNCVDVAQIYRDYLTSPFPSPATIRLCLTALSALRETNDISLVKSFLRQPIASIRKTAYTAWFKLASEEKDAIAHLALDDEATSVRSYAFDLTKRQGAFIAFDTVLACLSARQDWPLLLRFGQLERWNGLEAIAQTAFATQSGDEIRLELTLGFEKWGAMSSYTRPTKVQLDFLLAPDTMAIFESLAPQGAKFVENLRHELELVGGTRS